MNWTLPRYCTFLIQTAKNVAGWERCVITSGMKGAARYFRATAPSASLPIINPNDRRDP